MKKINHFIRSTQTCKANYNDLIKALHLLSNKTYLGGMKHFGIDSSTALGISMPNLRSFTKTIGKNHAIAQKLWNSNIHEARILASLVAEPTLTTKQEMDSWVKDFNSWDVCDQTCGNLFVNTPFAYDCVKTWCHAQEEFVRRAGFALIATLAVHDKKATDMNFNFCFDLIEQYAHDHRNFVKKAVNWALRNLGKRNMELNKQAIAVAKKIQTQESKSAKWIAADALRELTGEKIQERLMRKPIK